MKEIKRYKVIPYREHGRSFMPSFAIDQVGTICFSEDVDQLITDHKAVVETMQKRIDELKADNKTFKTDLVDLAIDLQILITEGMSAKKQMPILDKAESIITKFDN